MASVQAGAGAGAGASSISAVGNKDDQITWLSLQADGGEQTSSFKVKVPHGCSDLDEFRHVIKALEDIPQLKAVAPMSITFVLLRSEDDGDTWTTDKSLKPTKPVPSTDGETTLLLVKYPPSSSEPHTAATTGTAATDRKRGLEGEDDETPKRSRPTHVFTSTLNLSELVDSVADVKPFPLGNNEPASFVADPDWVLECGKTIRNGASMVEVGVRIPPLALVRCSRGGKTRALKEIQTHLDKTEPRVPCIFVSFNEWSTLSDWEPTDIVAALCQRIAFSALKNRGSLELETHFRSFQSTKVEPSLVVEWLGSNACVLLIDELNMGIENVDEAGRRSLGEFLKIHFLKNKDRYFVSLMCL